MTLKVNLACGGVFVTDDGWVNLDYVPSDPVVRQTDLLGRLPFATDVVDVVYSSHFLEHVPRSRVPALLSECFRILRPGGAIRLVLPDLEEMCREYLSRRAVGEHEKADLVVTEMIDQCVRQSPGGELGLLYRRYAADRSQYAEMIEYLRVRNGEDLRQATKSERRGADYRKADLRLAWKAVLTRVTRWPTHVRGRLQQAWFHWALGQLPSAFREQNVSLAGVGERHHWLWDLHQLEQALGSVGFQRIERCRCDTSRITDFPFYPLDMGDDGRPRKGAESMYVEASKPC